MSISPSHYKRIEISKILKEQDIITFLAIDTKTQSIVIELNHKYHPKTKKVIGAININNWTKFSENVVRELISPSMGIDRSHTILIKGNLDKVVEKNYD